MIDCHHTRARAQKRHVGNDAVHIVWTENKRDYDPKTITSQFNDVHIVVYPMPNGLYRVQVFKKQQVRAPPHAHALHTANGWVV